MLRLNLIPDAETLATLQEVARGNRKRAYMRGYAARRRADTSPEETARRARDRETGRRYAVVYRERQKAVLTDAEKEALRLRHREVGRASYRKAVADPAGRRRKLDQCNVSKRKIRAALGDQYRKKPCTDCGFKFPLCCMDFDHLDPSQKNPKVRYRNMVTLPRDLLEAEIAKCELVCACCHRIRTSKRLGSPTAEPWWTE